MDKHSNQFYEPERRSGMVGWAVKQLVMWVVGGFIVYSVVVNHQLFSGSAPDPMRQAATARADSASRSASSAGAPLVTNMLSLRARADGHVLVDAEVNGTPIHFLVDTGATWVSLTRDDAIRAGVAGGLDYSQPITTANGVVKMAPVTLRTVRIGQLEIGSVDATVMPEAGGISLLGQSFLNRLRSYEMRGDVLTLTWQD